VRRAGLREIDEQIAKKASQQPQVLRLGRPMPQCCAAASCNLIVCYQTRTIRLVYYEYFKVVFGF
jgi:hypothetical protein